MTITLNGTTGITTPAETVQGDLTTTGNTVLGNASTDTLNVANGGLVKDSSGNLGLGVTPSAWGSGWKAFQAGAYGQGYAAHPSLPISYLTSNAYYNGTNWIYSTSAYANYLAVSAQNGQFQWLTAPSGTAGNAITFTQAMTLDSSGNLLVGTTTQDSGAKFTLNHAGQVGQVYVNTGTGSAGVVYFRNGNGVVGQIATSGSSTSYQTSSDYRLKENIAPMIGALAKVSALKPVTYNWKVDGSAGQGFIAHELQAVVPDCVTGEKDAVDEEGNPIYQGIDTSFLVATLTAAIQEQQAIISDLKARIETLEQSNGS